MERKDQMNLRRILALLRAFFNLFLLSDFSCLVQLWHRWWIGEMVVCISHFYLRYPHVNSPVLGWCSFGPWCPQPSMSPALSVPSCLQGTPLGCWMEAEEPGWASLWQLSPLSSGCWQSDTEESPYPPANARLSLETPTAKDRKQNDGPV